MGKAGPSAPPRIPCPAQKHQACLTARCKGPRRRKAAFLLCPQSRDAHLTWTLLLGQQAIPRTRGFALGSALHSALQSRAEHRMTPLGACLLLRQC